MTTSRSRMLRSIYLVALALMAFAVSGVGANAAEKTPAAAPSDFWECGDIDDYVILIQNAVLDNSKLETLLDGDEFDPMTVSSRELIAVGVGLQDLSENMDDFDPDGIPRSLVDLHETWTDAMMVAGRMMETLGRDGVFATLAYTDVIDEIDAQLTVDLGYVQQHCPAEFAEYADFWPTTGESDEDDSL